MALDFIENHRQKYFCTAHYSLKTLKINLCSQLVKNVSSFHYTSWPYLWNLISNSMGIRRARGAKRAFAPRLEIGIMKHLFLEKPEVGILIPIN